MSAVPRRKRRYRPPDRHVEARVEATAGLNAAVVNVSDLPHNPRHIPSEKKIAQYFDVDSPTGDDCYLPYPSLPTELLDGYTARALDYQREFKQLCDQLSRDHSCESHERFSTRPFDAMYVADMFDWTGCVTCALAQQQVDHQERVQGEAVRLVDQERSDRVAAWSNVFSNEFTFNAELDCVEYVNPGNSSVIDDYINDIVDTGSHFLFTAPCGLGKSKFAPMKVAHRLGFRNVILLTERIMSTVSTLTWYQNKLPEGCTGVFGRAGGKDFSFGSRVSPIFAYTTGAYANLLRRGEQPSNDTLVILDEAHNVSLDTFDVCRHVKARQLLLCTASPVHPGAKADLQTPRASVCRFGNFHFQEIFERVQASERPSCLYVFPTARAIDESISFATKNGVVRYAHFSRDSKIFFDGKQSRSFSLAQLEEYSKQRDCCIFSTPILQESVTLHVSHVFDAGQRNAPTTHAPNVVEAITVPDERTLRVITGSRIVPIRTHEIVQICGRVGRTELSAGGVAYVNAAYPCTTRPSVDINPDDFARVLADGSLDPRAVRRTIECIEEALTRNVDRYTAQTCAEYVRFLKRNRRFSSLENVQREVDALYPPLWTAKRVFDVVVLPPVVKVPIEVVVQEVVVDSPTPVAPVTLEPPPVVAIDTLEPVEITRIQPVVSVPELRVRNTITKKKGSPAKVAREMERISQILFLNQNRFCKLPVDVCCQHVCKCVSIKIEEPISARVARTLSNSSEFVNPRRTFRSCSPIRRVHQKPAHVFEWPLPPHAVLWVRPRLILSGAALALRVKHRSRFSDEDYLHLVHQPIFERANAHLYRQREHFVAQPAPKVVVRTVKRRVVKIPKPAPTPELQISGPGRCWTCLTGIMDACETSLNGPDGKPKTRMPARLVLDCLDAHAIDVKEKRSRHGLMVVWSMAPDGDVHLEAASVDRLGVSKRPKHQKIIQMYPDRVRPLIDYAGYEGEISFATFLRTQLEELAGAELLVGNSLEEEVEAEIQTAVELQSACSAATAPALAQCGIDAAHHASIIALETMRNWFAQFPDILHRLGEHVHLPHWKIHLPSVHLPHVHLPLDQIIGIPKEFLDIPVTEALRALLQPFIDVGVSFAHVCSSFVFGASHGIPLVTSALRLLAFFMSHRPIRQDFSRVFRGCAVLPFPEPITDITPRPLLTNLYYRARPPAGISEHPIELQRLHDLELSRPVDATITGERIANSMAELLDSYDSRPVVYANCATDAALTELQDIAPEYVIKNTRQRHGHGCLAAAREIFMNLANDRIGQNEVVHTIASSVAQLTRFNNVVHNCAPTMTGRDHFRYNNLSTPDRRTLHSRLSCDQLFSDCLFSGADVILAPFSATSIHFADFLVGMAQRSVRKAFVITHLPAALIDERISEYTDPSCGLHFSRDGDLIATRHTNHSSPGYYDKAEAMLSWCKPIPIVQGYHSQVESLRQFGTMHLLEVRLSPGLHENHPSTQILRPSDFLILPLLQPSFLTDNKTKYFCVESRRFDALVAYVSTLDAGKIAFLPVANKLRGQMAEVKIGKRIIENRLSLNNAEFFSVVGHAILCCNMRMRNYTLVGQELADAFERFYARRSSFGSRFKQYYLDLFTGRLDSDQVNERTKYQRLLDLFFASSFNRDSLPVSYDSRRMVLIDNSAPLHVHLARPPENRLAAHRSRVSFDGISSAFLRLARTPLVPPDPTQDYHHAANELRCIDFEPDIVPRRLFPHGHSRTDIENRRLISQHRHAVQRDARRADTIDLRVARSRRVLSRPERVMHELPDHFVFTPQVTLSIAAGDVAGKRKEVSIVERVSDELLQIRELEEESLCYSDTPPTPAVDQSHQAAPDGHPIPQWLADFKAPTPIASPRVAMPILPDIEPFPVVRLRSATPLSYLTDEEPVVRLPSRPDPEPDDDEQIIATTVPLPDSVPTSVASGDDAVQVSVLHPPIVSNLKEIAYDAGFIERGESAPSTASSSGIDVDEHGDVVGEPTARTTVTHTRPVFPGANLVRIDVGPLRRRVIRTFSALGDPYSVHAPSPAHRHFLRQLPQRALWRANNEKYSYTAPDVGVVHLINELVVNALLHRVNRHFDRSSFSGLYGAEPMLVDSPEHKMWDVARAFVERMPGGHFRIPALHIDGLPGSAKSSMVREWLVSTKLRALIVVPTRELAKDWRAELGRLYIQSRCEVVTFFHPPEEKYDVMIIDEIFRYSPMHLEAWLRYAVDRPVITVGDRFQSGRQEHGVIRHTHAYINRRVLTFTISNTIPLDAFTYLARTNGWGNEYGTTSAVETSLFSCRPAPGPYQGFDLVMKTRSTDGDPSSDRVPSIAQVQGRRSSNVLYYGEIKPRAQPFFNVNTGARVVLFSRHSFTLVIMCTPTLLTSMFGFSSLRPVTNGTKISDLKDRLSVARPLDLVFDRRSLDAVKADRVDDSATIGLERSFTTGEVLSGINSSVEIRPHDRAIIVPEPQISDIQALIFDRTDFDLAADHEHAIDLDVPEAGGLRLLGELGLVEKHVHMRSIFTDAHKLGDVQVSHCRNTDFRSMQERQLSLLHPTVSFEAATRSASPLVDRFRAALLKDVCSPVQLDTDFLCQWLRTRSPSSFQGLEGEALNESIRTVGRTVFAKTQVKVKADKPEFPAGLPKGQGITTNHFAFGAYFAYAAHCIYTNLPRLVRDGVYLDFGLSDIELANILRDDGALAAFAECNTQLDVSSQDSSHDAVLTAAFCEIACLCGAPAEVMRMYYEYSSEFDVKSMAPGLYRGIMRFSLGSGDPFTLIRNVVQMLTVVSSMYVDVDNCFILQKGDDLLTDAKCIQLAPTAHHPSVAQVVLKIERDAPAYHAGRFFTSTDFIVDPVRAVFKHFARVYDPLVPAEELFVSFVSRCPRPSPEIYYTLFNFIRHFYLSFTDSDIWLILDCFCSLFSPGFFYRTLCRPELSPGVIDTSVDCTINVLRAVCPDLSPLKLRSYAGAPISDLVSLFSARSIPFHILDDDSLLDPSLRGVLIRPSHVSYVPFTPSHDDLKKANLNNQWLLDPTLSSIPPAARSFLPEVQSFPCPSPLDLGSGLGRAPSIANGIARGSAVDLFSSQCLSQTCEPPPQLGLVSSISKMFRSSTSSAVGLPLPPSVKSGSALSSTAPPAHPSSWASHRTRTSSHPLSTSGSAPPGRGKPSPMMSLKHSSSTKSSRPPDVKKTSTSRQSVLANRASSTAAPVMRPQGTDVSRTAALSSMRTSLASAQVLEPLVAPLRSMASHSTMTAATRMKKLTRQQALDSKRNLFSNFPLPQITL